jgi:hypothetical protein
MGVDKQLLFGNLKCCKNIFRKFCEQSLRKALFFYTVHPVTANLMP